MGFQFSSQVKSVLKTEKMNNLSLALFSTLIAFSNAGYWQAGPCPAKPEVITPFEVEQFLGDWYAQWATPMIYASKDNTCSRHQYGSLPQGVSNISLYIISTYPDTGLGDVCGWLQPADPLNPTGDINLYMGTEPSPSMILDTDYESFVASYSCTNHPFELTHGTFASIDTRDPIPSQDTIDRALEVFEKNGLTIDDWYPIVHTDDCVYDKDPSVWTCKNEWD